MIQLIVEDGGDRRGFRVGDGALTVGAGEQAKLRLDAPDVAAIHADLEVEDGVATLRPRPGVRPFEIGGMPVEGPLVMVHDQPVVLGGARLTVHYPEGSPMRKAPVAGASGSASVVPGAAAVANGGGTAGARPGVVRTGARRTSPGGVRALSQRARGRRRKNVGALTSLGILAGVSALVAAFVFVIGPRFMGKTPAEFEPMARIGAAQRLISRADYDTALAELDAIPTSSLTPQLAAQADALRADIERRRSTRARDVHNVIGSDWWRENLELFDKFHLRGTPEPGAVRMFLERLAYFEEEWPDHPQQEWVDRMQERYAEVVSLDDPPTAADLAFQVKILTEEEDPKRWDAALLAIDEFVRGASASARDRGVALRTRTVEARQEWFEASMDRAREEYASGEDGGKSRSVAWLMRIVGYSGDAAMAEEAANQLLRFTSDDDFDLSAELRGYRSHKPEMFTRVAEYPKVAAYLRANPL